VVFRPEDRRRILELVDDALCRGSLTLGPVTAQFEHDFSARVGSKFAVATSSGTSALEILFRGLGLGGTEVVVPANTFFATAAAVLHAGGRPRFADVDPATLALSEATVRDAITADTAAVVIVHIGGLVSPEIEGIRTLCEQRGLVLIEDAAHAHGSVWAGRPAGSLARAAAFSFYPTKVVASAEGGMIVTDDEALSDEARIFRDQGKSSFVGAAHIRLGSAWRMSEVHAAIGLVHLQRLEEFVTVRRAVARRYDEELGTLAGLELLREPERSRSNYYKYPALLAPGIDRGGFKEDLRRRFGVSLSGEVYATPLHLEPVFAGLAERPLPVAEDVCARQVCLPVHSDMTEGEVDRVVASVTAALSEMPSRR
jgi:dTDP-4-amino-4,6-dideoxygalactose transaminase